ncbi:MAG TPA: hypothetical protein PKW95_05465 [bacterium]|nr:hypothetical protein [bacterium]
MNNEDYKRLVILHMNWMLEHREEIFKSLPQYQSSYSSLWQDISRELCNKYLFYSLPILDDNLFNNLGYYFLSSVFQGFKKKFYNPLLHIDFNTSCKIDVTPSIEEYKIKIIPPELLTGIIVHVLQFCNQLHQAANINTNQVWRLTISPEYKYKNSFKIVLSGNEIFNHININRAATLGELVYLSKCLIEKNWGSISLPAPGDTTISININPSLVKRTFQRKIAFSCAGRDKKFVDQVWQLLGKPKNQIFYYRDDNITTEFENIKLKTKRVFEKESIACVLFWSRNYQYGSKGCYQEEGIIQDRLQHNVENNETPSYLYVIRIDNSDYPENEFRHAPHARVKTPEEAAIIIRRFSKAVFNRLDIN